MLYLIHKTELIQISRQTLNIWDGRNNVQYWSFTNNFMYYLFTMCIYVYRYSYPLWWYDILLLYHIGPCYSYSLFDIYDHTKDNSTATCSLHQWNPGHIQQHKINIYERSCNLLINDKAYFNIFRNSIFW